MRWCAARFESSGLAARMVSASSARGILREWDIRGAIAGRIGILDVEGGGRRSGGPISRYPQIPVAASRRCRQESKPQFHIFLERGSQGRRMWLSDQKPKICRAKCRAMSNKITNDFWLKRQSLYSFHLGLSIVLYSNSLGLEVSESRKSLSHCIGSTFSHQRRSMSYEIPNTNGA